MKTVYSVTYCTSFLTGERLALDLKLSVKVTQVQLNLYVYMHVIKDQVLLYEFTLHTGNPNSLLNLPMFGLITLL